MAQPDQTRHSVSLLACESRPSPLLILHFNPIIHRRMDLGRDSQVLALASGVQIHSEVAKARGAAGHPCTLLLPPIRGLFMPQSGPSIETLPGCPDCRLAAHPTLHSCSSALSINYRNSRRLNSSSQKATANTAAARFTSGQQWIGLPLHSTFTLQATFSGFFFFKSELISKPDG